MIHIPDLTLDNALRFSSEINSSNLEDGEVFDFSSVKKCDPFPMLVVSSSIRRKRTQFPEKQYIARNHTNSYAKHMRFYTAIGIENGRDFSEDYGNHRYLPITKLDVEALRQEGFDKYKQIQEVIENRAGLMADVLSQGNELCQQWLGYALTEIMRNIPEHSNASEIWYCAQYWPFYDLVELAILDEGIGVKNSLLSNAAFVELISSDKEALYYALKPGISRMFVPGGMINSSDMWDNSGYGLYMISRTCAELGGNFLIFSGDAAMMVDDTGVNPCVTECHLSGTAIRIQIRLSALEKYEEVIQRVLNDGEAEARSDNNRIRTASKSTRSILQKQSPTVLTTES